MGLGEASLSFTVLDPEKIPLATRPRWAVLGRSNVGKSTFLNALIHPNSLFRTGRTPGVTRGLIGVRIKLGRSEESTLECVDLPGFGFAQAAERALWMDLAETLREKSQQTGLHWIWLVDPTRAPADEERALLEWLGQETYTFVFTKSDKIKNSGRAACLKAWARQCERATEGPFWVSSLKGTGFDEIQKSARNFVRSLSEKT